jgi:hypothetical protein
MPQRHLLTKVVSAFAATCRRPLGGAEGLFTPVIEGAPHVDLGAKCGQADS